MFVGALGGWGLQQVWRITGELDTQGPRNGVKTSLKRAKTEAMQEMLDALVDGDLGRVDAAADGMTESALQLHRLLNTAIYEEHGAGLVGALEDVHTAVAADDLDAARDATFRLEDNCMGCHRALREQAVDKP